jgi:hypothetical protein
VSVKLRACNSNIRLRRLLGILQCSSCSGSRCWREQQRQQGSNCLAAPWERHQSVVQQRLAVLALAELCVQAYFLLVPQASRFNS